MNLDAFLREYEEDDNAWWRLSSGHHQNLFDALLERAEKAEAALEKAEKERDHYKKACYKMSHEVEQTLGKALGYTHYTEDIGNPEEVCVGDHVPESLAAEAAERIEKAEAKIREIAVNCPSCGRHDFGLVGPMVKKACGPCMERAEKAEADAKQLRDMLEDACPHWCSPIRCELCEEAAALIEKTAYLEGGTS